MFNTMIRDDRLNVDWKVILKARKRHTTNQRLQEFYGRCLEVFSGTLAQTPFVALDFETTGLDPSRDEIISIGAVPFALDCIRIKEGRHWLVSPQRRLKEDSVVIHGITHGDIDGAPGIGLVLEELLAVLSGSIVVVHYHPIERQFLSSAFCRHTGEEISFPVIDTMMIERSVRRRAVATLLRRLQGRSPVSVRLGRSRQRYGLPAYRAHHAFTDALATAELFQAQVAHHYSARTRLAELLV